MGRWAVVVCALAGCGRVGFGDPPATCSDLAAGSPSGSYWLAHGEYTYCEMDTAGGGWTRIADVDAAAGCPGEWTRVVDPAVCIANLPLMTGGTRSAEFASPIPYSEVMGYVQAYQYGSCDAFGDGPGTIESRYVDGLSITYRDNGARKHVWTHACGWSNRNFLEPYHLCPCEMGGTAAPTFVGNAYLCASGHNDAAVVPQPVWQLADPLYDGTSPGSGCDTGGRFVTSVGATTDSPLEARLMMDQAAENEDMGVYRMELYVR